MSLASGSVRFPLQTGQSALRALIHGAMLLLLTGFLFSFFLSIIGILTGTIGVFVFFAGLFRLKKAWEESASDLVITSECMTIEGGELDGKILDWSDVAPERCEILEINETTLNKGTVDTSRLIVGFRDGDSLSIAEAQSLEERASLDAVLESLRSPKWRGQETAPRPPRPAADVVILVCPQCGAPATPADAASAACVYCGAEIHVPDDLRARVRAGREMSHAQAKLERRVLELLDQPRADVANLHLVVAAGVMVIAVLVTAVWGVAGAFASLALMGLSLTALWSTIGDRLAVRAIILGVGAVDPDRPGAPYLCRACRAPLPMEERAIVRCAYCEAQNVKGIDLGHESDVASSAFEMGELLRARRKRLFVRIGVSAVAALDLLLVANYASYQLGYWSF